MEERDGEEGQRGKEAAPGGEKLGECLPSEVLFNLTASSSACFPVDKAEVFCKDPGRWPLPASVPGCPPPERRPQGQRPPARGSPGTRSLGARHVAQTQAAVSLAAHSQLEGNS